MKVLLTTVLCLGLGVAAVAQNSDTEPASKDDVILFMRTMRSHDVLERTMVVMSQSMQKLMRDQIIKDKGKLPANYDLHMKKAMDDLVKGMPMDELIQSVVPSYQKHFTKSDIESMNAYYSSPTGQKVLEVMPVVMQEGMQAEMPILTKYLDQWKQRMRSEIEQEDSSPKPSQPKSAPQN